MNDFSTNDSEFIDIVQDIGELMIKIERLNEDNNLLTKRLRENEHELAQKATEYGMENEKLKRSNESLEELMKTYKSLQKPQTDDPEEEEKIIPKIGELENKLFLAEQGEQNLKRQNQSLNMEISNLKLQLDKFNLNSKNSEIPTIPKQSNSDYDNLDEDTKNLLNDLMNEIEELKKEKNEVSEKACNFLTEKELELMDVREQMDELKQKQNEDINKYLTQIHDLKSDLEDKDWKRGNNDNNDDEDRQSINSEEARVLLEKYKELSDEYDDFKTEADERNQILLYENEKIKREISINESKSKNVQDLENEISRLKTEISNNEYERYQKEKELHDDSKNMYLTEFENFQNQIINLQELKEKSEFKYKEKIKRLDEDLREFEEANNLLKTQKNEIEKKLNNFIQMSNKNLKEMQEKTRNEIITKEKENIQFKERIDHFAKENEYLKKDLELSKKNSEKTKSEYRELNETLKKIRENNEKELNKWEERYYIIENKLSNEKNNLFEANKDLLMKLHSYKLGEIEREREKEKERERSDSIGMEDNQSRKSLIDQEMKFGSLSALLSNEDSGKITLLTEEISMLNNQISELNMKIKFFDKQKTGSDILLKENSKLKGDIKELKEMYETQISDLQHKLLQMGNEIQNTRRKTTNRMSLKDALNPKQLQILTEFENTISRLIGENKYHTEKIEILTNEIINLKLLREKDTNFFKEEVRAAEELAICAKVNLATLAYEKETELVKYKSMCKKLKLRLTGGATLGVVKK